MISQINIHASLCLLFLLGLGQLVWSQPFYQEYGEPGIEEFATCVISDTNGNRYLGCSIDSKAAVVKLNNTGQILWSRVIGSSAASYSTHTLTFSPDGYILGTTVPFIPGSFTNDPSVYFKLSSAGDLVWSKELSGTVNTVCHKMTALNMDEYFLTAFRMTSFGNNNDIVCMGVDAISGNLIWNSPRISLGYGGLNDFLEEVTDNTIIEGIGAFIVGRIYAGSTGNDVMRPFILKTELDGSADWAKFYYTGASVDARIYASQIEADGDTLIMSWFGALSGTSLLTSQIGITKTDLDGNVLQQFTYQINASQSERTFGLTVLDDGYLMFGVTNTFQSSGHDWFVFKTDKNGAVMWSKSLGWPGSDDTFPAYSFHADYLENDSSALICGMTKNGNDFDIMLAGMNGSQISGCVPEDDLDITKNSIANFSADAQIFTLPYTPTIVASSISSYVLPPPCGNNMDIISADTIIVDSFNPPVTIASQATGSPLAYLWNTSESTPDISVQNVGWYSVVVTYDCCPAISDSVFVSNCPPVTAVIVSDYVGGCAPQTIQAYSDMPDLSSTWFLDGQVMSDEATVELVFEESGLYELTLVSGSDKSCLATDTATYWIEILPPGDVSAAWSIDPPDPCADSGVYVLNYTGLGQTNIQWSYPGGTSELDSCEFLLLASETALVTLVAMDSVCGLIDSMVVEYSQLGVIQAECILQLDGSIGTCAPQLLLATGQSNLPSLSWFINGLFVSSDPVLNYVVEEGGDYSLWLVSGSELPCTVSDTVIFEFSVQPPTEILVDWQMTMPDSCANSGVYNFLYTGSGETDLLWTFPGGQSGSNSISFVLDAPDAGWVTLVATDETCGVSDTIAQYVEQLGNVAVAATANDSAGCIPFSTFFSADGDGQLFWYVDNDLVAEGPGFEYEFNSGGGHMVVVTAVDSAACNFSASDTLWILVYEPLNPSWSITTSPFDVCSDSLSVFCVFTGSGATGVNWNSSNGQSSLDQATQFSIYDEGLWTFNGAAVNDLCGQEDVVTSTIEFTPFDTPRFELCVPNIITPNGDGLNDQFRVGFSEQGISSNDFDLFELFVFDRWGNQVFESNSTDIAWGDVAELATMDDGTYFYVIRYRRKCFDSETSALTGTVAIIH